VRLAGIEPTTPWFVAKYSIQLSYSRKTKSIALVIGPNFLGLTQNGPNVVVISSPYMRTVSSIRLVSCHAYFCGVR
jgi:hypothetical protein